MTSISLEEYNRLYNVDVPAPPVRASASLPKNYTQLAKIEWGKDITKIKIG